MSILTTAQKATLKADMLGASNAALSSALAANDFRAVADYYNSNGVANVWRESVPVDEVADAINWANLTPSDTPDGTTLWANRAAQCRAKQANLEMMLSRATGLISGHLSGVRQGFQDALTNVPSGASGALQSAGAVAVRAVLQRVGTRLELLFSQTDGAAQKSSVYGMKIDARECFAAYAGLDQ